MRQPTNHRCQAEIELPSDEGKTIAYYTLCMDQRLGSAAKAVGACLVDHFNRKTGQCDPGITRIGDRTGKDRSTVFRALTELEEAGYIRRDRYGGKGHRNAYEIVWKRMQQSSTNDDHVDQRSQDCDGNGRTDATVTVARMRPKPLKEPLKKPLKRGSAGKSFSNRTGQSHLPLVFEGGYRKRRPSNRIVMEAKAEERWEGNLRRTLGAEYPTAVNMITPELMRAATQHEIQQPGQGHDLILSAMMTNRSKASA